MLFGTNHKQVIFDAFQILFQTASLIFTAAKLFYQVIQDRTKHKPSTALHPQLPDFKPKRTRYAQYESENYWVNNYWSISCVTKSTLKFTKSPSLVLIRLVLTGRQQFKNVKINKKNTLCSYSVRMAIHFFVNLKIFKWMYLTYHFHWYYCTGMAATRASQISILFL